ncbi:histidyl-tRNA synthetase, partial [Pisolithus tinctorius]
TSLSAEIKKQTAILNELRLQNNDPVRLDATKKELGELKRRLAATARATDSAANGATAVSGDKDDAKKRERLLLKTAKGTRDYGPAETYCRDHIERIVKDVFMTYGGSCLDTPVFERKDDQKLIFDLMDQGGEQLALRYDHTVPLARYIAMSGATIQGKIWQVGKVYRRDSPVMSKGRMREFMQADLDIVGDAEIVSLLCTILSKLEVGEFTIKINHRKILDGIFEVCGVPPEKIRSISSAVDKLDKAGLADSNIKSRPRLTLSQVADKIGEYVKHKGGPALLEQLKADEILMSNPSAKQGLLKAYNNVIDRPSAPPGFSAANAVVSPVTDGAPAPAPPKKKSKKPKAETLEEEEEIDESQVGVGSIAAGGRYDNLVGIKAPQLPCIGVSIGMDRIFAIIWPKWVEKGMRSKETMVYVMAAGDGLLEERIRLVQELREAGIKVRQNRNYRPQFSAAEKDEVPFDIILGADELKEGLVTVKEQKWEFVDGKKAKVQSTEQGIKVRREELVSWLKNTPTYLNWSSGRLI